MNTEELEALIQQMAEKYALNVEWKGDDYGARKQYYKDAFTAGAKAFYEIGKIVGRSEATAKEKEGK